MQFKQLIALTYAVTAAGLAIGLTSDYTRSLQEHYSKFTVARVDAQTKPQEMGSVLTANRTVPVGQKLTPDVFTVVSWPAHAVPVGAMRTIDEVFLGGGDKFARAELVAGELMLPGKVSETGNGSALSLMLPPGMRAVTVQTNEVRGVGGFVQPNDTVDILLTEAAASDGKAKPRATRVILQNIRILAMGQDIRSTANQPKVARSATIAVTLEDAQKLALATTIGQISFALRNPQQEKQTASLREVSLKDLAPPAKKAQRSGKMEVVVHRAGNRAGQAGQSTRVKYTY